MPSGSTCVQGTKSKHAFIILTLICSQKHPSVENCETACLKDLRLSLFFFFPIDTKILTVFPVTEHSNVKYCKHQFRVFLFPKNPSQPTNPLWCQLPSHEANLVFCHWDKLPRHPWYPEIAPLPTSTNFCVLTFSLFPFISSFTLALSFFPWTAALHTPNGIQLWREHNPGRRESTQSLTGP